MSEGTDFEFGYQLTVPSNILPRSNGSIAQKTETGEKLLLPFLRF